MSILLKPPLIDFMFARVEPLSQPIILLLINPPRHQRILEHLAIDRLLVCAALRSWRVDIDGAGLHRADVLEAGVTTSDQENFLTEARVVLDLPERNVQVLVQLRLVLRVDGLLRLQIDQVLVLLLNQGLQPPAQIGDWPVFEVNVFID